MVLQGHLAGKNYYICTTRVLMATKPGSMVTYIKWLPRIKLLDPLVMWFFRSLDKLKQVYLHYCSASDNQTLHVCDLPWGAPIVLSSDALIAWSCLITWQTRYIPLLLQYLFAIKLGKVVAYHEELPFIKFVMLCGFVGWRDILNTLYLHLL